MNPDGPEYHAAPVRCRSCQVRDGTREQFTKAGGDAHGLFMSVEVEG